MSFPLVFAGLLIIILAICIVVVYVIRSRKEITFEKRWFNTMIFVLSLVSLIISIKLFWNMGSYADENGSSPVLINGGWFWLYMNWIRMALLLILSVVSGISLFTRQNQQ